MLFRRLFSTCALTLALALPASAQTEMSEAERDAFRAEVRAYLLENPEVLMEAIGVLEARQAEAARAADLDMVAANLEALTNDGVSYVGGNPDGDITLVEFMDYRCGYCRRAFVEVEQLVALDGNIRLILKEFPILGEQSMLASRFAIATQLVAGDDAYKDVHDALMSLNADVTEATLTQLGDSIGLDTPEIIAAMDSEEVTAVISANRELAQALQITGTPTFVMQDQMLRGYVPLDQMLVMVEALRDEG